MFLVKMNHHATSRMLYAFTHNDPRLEGCKVGGNVVEIIDDVTFECRETDSCLGQSDKDKKRFKTYNETDNEKDKGDLVYVNAGAWLFESWSDFLQKVKPVLN